MARSQRTAGYLLLAAAAAALLQLSSAAAFRCPSKIDARRPLPTRVALSYGSTPPRFLFQPQLLLFMSSDKDNDDDDDAASNNLPGMSEAFRQLESLDSLFDPEEYIPAPDKIDVEAVLDREASTLLQGAKAVEVAPEQDFAVYRNMMEELEQNEDAEAYAELLDELGNSSLQTDDTYSQVLTELGGTRPAAVGTKTASNKVDATPSILSSDASKEQFMEEALQEALKEVKVNNPRLTDSILDNKEIMREIESIFDQGNEKLIASLEEIRIEQVRMYVRCVHACLCLIDRRE